MAEENEHAQEAKERWGNTEVYKQSQENYKKMTEEELTKIKKENDALMKEIAACIDEDVRSEKVQKLIDRHFNNLRHFYEPSLTMYRGIGKMYTSDERFASYYEKYAKGLAEFMKEAILAYCDIEEAKK